MRSSKILVKVERKKFSLLIRIVLMYVLFIYPNASYFLRVPQQDHIYA